MGFCKMVYSGLRCWLDEGHEQHYATREHQYRIDRDGYVEEWRVGSSTSKAYAESLVSQGRIKIR